MVEAHQSRPKKRKDGTTKQDPKASWHVKQGSDGKRRSTYGFIKSTDDHSGCSHDSNHLTGLLSGQESAAYADSADQSEQPCRWLAKRGIQNRLTKRADRNQPLTRKGQRFLYFRTYFPICSGKTLGRCFRCIAYRVSATGCPGRPSIAIFFTGQF